MGTSKGYQMPTGGKWTPLKHDATDFVQGTGNKDIGPGDLMKDFIRASGGVRGLTRGSGGSAPSITGGAAGGGSAKRRGGGSGSGGGGGASGGKTSAAVGTARNLGGFLSSVATVGLEQALRQRGLDDAVGKSASDVSDALLDEFAGPASTLDNALARESLAEIREEILGDALTFEDVEERLNAAIDERGIFGILVSFFGHYIFKMFVRNFSEEWVKKVGETKAAKSLGLIKDYVDSSLRAKLAGRKVATVDWQKRDGQKFVEDVWKETIDVFGVTG
jgi:hypothetical protein